MLRTVDCFYTVYANCSLKIAIKLYYLTTFNKKALFECIMLCQKAIQQTFNTTKQFRGKLELRVARVRFQQHILTCKFVPDDHDNCLFTFLRVHLELLLWASTILNHTENIFTEVENDVLTCINIFNRIRKLPQSVWVYSIPPQTSGSLLTSQQAEPHSLESPFPAMPLYCCVQNWRKRQQRKNKVSASSQG